MSAFFLMIGRFIRRLGWRNILIGALIIAVFFMAKRLFFPGKPAARPISSLFQRVEYLENLRLVTYHFEEILTIGKPERYEIKLDRQQEAVAQAQEVRIEMEHIRDKAEDDLKKAINQYSTLLLAQDVPRLQYDLTKDRLKLVRSLDIPRRNSNYRGNFITNTNLRDSLKIYSPDLHRAFLLYTTTSEARAKESARQKLLSVYGRLKDSLKVEKDRTRELFQLARDRFKEDLNRLKKVKKDAERGFSAAQNLVKDAFKEEQRAVERLKELQAEKEKQEAQTEEKPRLAVVVSAQVTGYVNLNELRYRQMGDTLLIDSMPSPMIDSVLIMLDSSRYYSLRRVFNFASTGPERFYNEVYQELKEAILEKQVEVKDRAILSGIQEETEQMAREYLRDFAFGLGYTVLFPEEIPAFGHRLIDSLTSFDSAQVVISESLRPAVDSLLKVDSIRRSQQVRSRSLSPIKLEEGVIERIDMD